MFQQSRQWIQKANKSPNISCDFLWCFSWYYTAFANASNSANKSHLSIFCVPNQPLSAPKWQSGSSMPLKLERHRTIESCGSMSSLHKAAGTSIQLFVPLNWQPNANYHSALHSWYSCIISISQGQKTCKYVIRKILLGLAGAKVHECRVFSFTGTEVCRHPRCWLAKSSASS